VNRKQKYHLTQRLKTLTAKRYELQTQLNNPNIADEAIETLERKLRSLDVEIGLIRTQVDYYPKVKKKLGRPRKKRQAVTVEATPMGSGEMLKRINNIGTRPYKTVIQNAPEPIIRQVIADLKRALDEDAMTIIERRQHYADILFWQETLNTFDEVTL
jgi:hypothetical protein